MVFSSAPFIFMFLPVVFLIYSIVPGLRGKNAFLTIASLLFYAYGEPVFALVMLASVLMNYVFARIIAVRSNATEHQSENGESGSVGAGKPVDQNRGHDITADAEHVHHTVLQRIVLAISVIANLALIGVFKYAGFFIETVNDITGAGLHVPEIALPIGISFFTFQAMSYVIDVYRAPDTVQKNFGKVLLYISFFPQLIAGPIVKYHDIAPYLDERHADIDEIASGIQRFVTGLAKKMFLANSMGLVADTMFGLAEMDMSVATAWTGAICYTLQIFFDFSGYSDMAIGIGHMFGFTIKENFDHPYIATSIKEFWRRWHISLSTWFKEYLYIPLGGSRHGKIRTELNKLIVFFATGLWHGASWNFVIWGMIHGVAITVEDILGLGRAYRPEGSVCGLHATYNISDHDKMPKSNAGDKLTNADGSGDYVIEKKPNIILRFVGWIYTTLIVILAFVLFRADTLSDGIVMLRMMFTGGLGNLTAFNTLMEMASFYNLAMFVIALFTCVPHRFLNKYIRERGPVSYLVTLALFVLCALEIAGGTFNPFIYFRF